jgi:hypothetical protein
MKTKILNIVLSISLLLIALFLSACTISQTSDLPKIIEQQPIPESTRRQIQQSCEKNFFQGYYEFVHSIVFELANGQGATVIGVTVLDGETLKTGLMGVEGFVLFEAVLNKDKQLEVNRAMPPFDNAEFAAGLMRDVQILFRAPSDENHFMGYLTDGQAVCRYFQNENQITDIIVNPDGSSRINVYDPGYEQIRSIINGPPVALNGEMIPETIEFEAYGLRGYTLKMTLISVDNITKK